MRFRLIVLAVLMSFIALPVSALADRLPSMPENYVVDLAGILDSQTEASLNGYLKELEQKTSVQFIVLTVKSLDGLSIENYSLQAAEKWKLGQKDKDNGLLMTVSLNDRKYRFEVGYGLEGTLPDSLVGSIGREYLVQNFRQKKYSRGVRLAVAATITTLAKSYGVTVSGLPKLGHRRSPSYLDRNESQLHAFCSVFFIPLVIVIILIAVILSPRSSSGWGAGGSSGGSFGGGFSGGFGGGGGGSFGGGGASGGW